MSYTPVTNKQLEQVRKMAREKGVGKKEFQRGLDESIFAATLDRLKESEPSERVKPSSLLRRIGTVRVPSVSRFYAANAFGIDNPAEINFWLDPNFEANFLNKIEENITKRELVIDLLIESSLDGPIRAALTPAREESNLADLYELIKRQPKGQAGKLLTNGNANIFYIRDVHGNSWAVGTGWSSFDDAWDIEAFSITDLCRWTRGHQVFSQVGQ
jgi:hypothetical protein